MWSLVTHGILITLSKVQWYHASFLFSICSPWLLDIRISTCYWYNVFTIVIHNDGPGKLRQLNFARIIRAYVSKFAQTDPREAVQYYYLLR